MIKHECTYCGMDYDIFVTQSGAGECPEINNGVHDFRRVSGEYSGGVPVGAKVNFNPYNGNAVNPQHYRHLPNGLEMKDVAQWFPFNIGNAIKYLWRAGHKTTDMIEDLEKAKRYIEFEIARIKEYGKVDK